MLKIKRMEKFNGVGNKTTFKFIKQYLVKEGNFAVEIYDDAKLVKLNIPHGELYTICSDKEWLELEKILSTLQ